MAGPSAPATASSPPSSSTTSPSPRMARRSSQFPILNSSLRTGCSSRPSSTSCRLSGAWAAPVWSQKRGHRPRFALRIRPSADGLRQFGLGSAVVHQVEHLGHGDVAGLAPEEGLHHADGGEVTAALEEALLQEDPLVVPAQEPRVQLVGFEGGEAAAVAHGDAAHEGLPAVPQHGPTQLRAEAEVEAAQVHDAQEAPVVHVDVHIQVVGPHAEAEDRRSQRLQGRTEPEGEELPEGAEEQNHPLSVADGCATLEPWFSRSRLPPSSTVSSPCSDGAQTVSTSWNWSPPCWKVWRT